MKNQIIRKHDKLFNIFFLTLIKDFKCFDNNTIYIWGKKAGERFIDVFAINNNIFNKIKYNDVSKYIKLFIEQYLCDINVIYCNGKIIFDENLLIFSTPRTIVFIQGILQSLLDKLVENSVTIQYINNFTLSI